MKKLGLTILICAFVVSANAQSMKVQSAFTYMKSLQLDKAKENIDAACLHESTMNEAKTWRYKALIYCLIADAKYVTANDPSYAKLKKYKEKPLADNPVDVAYEALQKSMELDKTNHEFDKENFATKSQFGYQYIRVGIDEYTQKKYQEALGSFEKAKTISYDVFQVAKVTQMVDPKQPLSYACIAAEYGAVASSALGNTDKALENYKFVLGNKDPKEISMDIYTNTFDLYFINKNDSIAAQKVIARAASVYPDSMSVITRQVNVFLKMGKKEEAKKALDALAAKDPNNYIVYSAIGDIHRQNGDIEAAQASYEKSISIKSNFDAYYNLGAMFLNRSVETLEKSDKISAEGFNKENEAKIKKLEESAKGDLTKAAGYLESAVNLNPTDKATLEVLKKIYVKLGQIDDMNRINAKIEALKTK